MRSLATVCEGDRHDLRLFARRARDRRTDVLSRLRSAAAGAVLSEALSSRGLNLAHAVLATLHIRLMSTLLHPERF